MEKLTKAGFEGACKFCGDIAERLSVCEFLQDKNISGEDKFFMIKRELVCLITKYKKMAGVL